MKTLITPSWVKTVYDANSVNRDTALRLRDSGEWAFDIESYSNYFLVCFLNDADEVLYFDSDDGVNIPKLKWVLENFSYYGFNSNHYDLVVSHAVLGSKTNDLAGYAKDVTNLIIDRMSGAPRFEILKALDFKRDWDKTYRKQHYDIKDVAFGNHSLKFYAACLGVKELQDLPYEPNALLTPEERAEVRSYCMRDCFNTRAIRKAISEPMSIRKMFGEEYFTDLRSMKDAAVAERLIVREYEIRKGVRVEKRPVPDKQVIRFKMPEYVSFQTDQLRSLGKELDGMNFTVNYGKIHLGEMENRVVTIGDMSYKLGIGGIHSQEKTITHRATSDLLLIDCDVTSYYPNLILRNGYYPPALGRTMLETYQRFVDRRVEAKAKGDALQTNGLKIPLNATFGKLGEQHSALYAPEMFLNVTLSGQMLILSLIESFTQAGFEVISANTDGVVTKVPSRRLDEYRALLRKWENVTRFGLEETHYKTIYSRDVNNYVAVYADGKKYKAKGTYSAYGLSSLQAKTPKCQIVKDAIIEYLVNDTPVEKTIRECKDFIRFTVATNVKSGGFIGGKSLGKVVRFYYSKTSDKYIANAIGNRVPEAQNVEECMRLPDKFPEDLGYETYIAMARKKLASDFSAPKQFTFDL